MTLTADPIMNTTDWSGIARSVAASLRPGVAARDVAGEIDAASFQRLREAGLTAALVPHELGGGGATHAEMGSVLRELGGSDPSTAVALSMHSHLVAAQVWRHRHGIDTSAVLRKVADGAILVSTGASDWLGSNGSARRVDGGYRVSARKSPASGCSVGQVLVTSIRWDDAPDGPQVLHCAVPLDAAGVRVELTWDTLGLRATGSDTVVLDDVFVPDAAVSLARPADRWHPVWNVVMGTAMPLIMAAYMGITDAAVEVATAAAMGRTEAHVLQLIGEMTNGHITANDLVDGMFREADNLQFANTDDLSSRILARKTVAADLMIETVRLALEIVGGSGYQRGSGVERLYRDVHGVLFHPLPRARQTHFTGRVTLGLDPIG